MSRLHLRPLALVGFVALSVPTWAQPSGSIRCVKTLKTSGAVEIEIDGSDRLVPQTRVLTSPDRLVIDFRNTLPGAQLRNVTVNQGDVKSFRVGLFQANPPITRLVVDLASPQSFQVFPDGRTVMIRLTGTEMAQAKPAEPAADPGPLDDFPPAVSVPKANASSQESANLASTPLEVTFHNGMLFIHANKASLSEVLFAVHQRTGADIDIAAGAEQEKVVADIGPAPAPEVLNQLLNGSRFNFLIVSAPNNPNSVDRVILTMRGEGISAPPIPSMGEQPEPQPPVAALQRTPPDTTQIPPDTTPENPD